MEMIYIDVRVLIFIVGLLYYCIIYKNHTRVTKYPLYLEGGNKNCITGYSYNCDTSF